MSRAGRIPGLAAGTVAPGAASLASVSEQATIFLPVSFLTGFFGQNFSFLTGHVLNHTCSFFVLGLGLLITSSVVLWLFFRRKGWLTPD